MHKSKTDLYESSLKFLQPLNIEQTYRTVVEEAVKLSGGSSGSIILARRGQMKRVYASDKRISNITLQKYGRSYSAYKNQQTLLLNKKDMETVHPEFSELNVTSNLLIPLINRGRSMGVLSIYKEGGPNFSDKEKEVLQNFSPMASMAIRKAQLYGELHQAVETRDLFLSMASHELKTPITTIYVYLQLMQRNMKKNKKFDPNWVQTLLDEMVRLTKIIDELLELSRIRTGKLTYNFSPVDISEIVDRSLVNFKANHKHKIIYENKLKNKSALAIGDFDKLMEVSINILDNAAKHSPISEPIQIKLSSNSKLLIIEVKDKGSGIDQKDIKKVFNGFFKTIDNTKPGMGLGLYLSKQIIDAHKGKIKLTSRLKKGTTAKIYIPKIKYEH